jgi:hypothetical protein
MPFSFKQVFDRLLHKVVHGNAKRRSMATIAVALYGDESVDAKKSRLYRQVNPDDEGAWLYARDLAALATFLNEGLTDAEKAEQGGDRLLMAICAEAGLVAYRPKSAEAATGDILKDALGTVVDFLRSAMRFGSFTNIGGSSAETLVGVDAYKVQSSIKVLSDYVQSMRPPASGRAN